MPLLELRAIVKRFGAVEAVRGVDLTVNAGEVVGLVGDNAAGKSTLFKVIAGVYPPDAGTMRFEGRSLHLTSPGEARHLGIEMVYQDLALCNNLTAAKNIFLGREPYRGFGPLKLLNYPEMHARAEALMRGLEIDVKVRELVKNMSGGQRQAVAIARALVGKAKLILLDEPTAAISIAVVEQVLDLIRRLKAQGLTILIISHRMPDIFAVCDRVVVMRRGEKVADRPVAETTPELLTGLITGAIARA
jgi:simple sugar transport system ATP-binding protein